MKPTQILQRLCKENKLETPHYFQGRQADVQRCTNIHGGTGRKKMVEMITIDVC